MTYQPFTLAAPAQDDMVADDLFLLTADCPGLTAITTLPDLRTRFFPHTAGLNEMVDYILSVSATQNVYMPVCTFAQRPTRGRGGESDTLALPGLVLDIDIAGPAHADVAGRLPLPATREEALTVVDGMPFAPTMVYDTGHGLLVRYLFDEPVVFNVDPTKDRDRAKSLSHRWNAHAVSVGRTHGVHVDNVSDLARLTRLAGTINHKLDPVAVRVLEHHPERRYRPAELAAALPVIPGPPPASPAQGPMRPFRSDGGESPAEAFARCVSWQAILVPAGFVDIGTRGDTTYWRHPAASSPAGTPSATTDANGVPVMVVFSESAGATTGLPVGPGRRLTKFRVWSILNHQGNESTAARVLLAMVRDT